MNELEVLRAQIAALEAEKKRLEYAARLVDIGMTHETADKAAQALIDGNAWRLFDCLKQFKTELEEHAKRNNKPGLTIGERVVAGILARNNSGYNPDIKRKYANR